MPVLKLAEISDLEKKRTECHQPWHSYSTTIWIVELSPGDDGSDVHEASKVQDNIDDTVDLIMACFRFFEVLAIPIQPGAGNEARQQIIGSEHSTSADREKADSSGQEQIGLAIDVFPERVKQMLHTPGASIPSKGELGDIHHSPAHDCTIDSGHENRV